MELGTKHEVCVMVKVKAFNSDAAWNKVYTAFADDPDVKIAGAPRCDRAALKHHADGSVNLMTISYPDDPDLLTQAIAGNPGLLDKVDPETAERIKQMLGMTYG